MLEITRKTLWDQRKNLLGWAIGLAGASFIYTGAYAVFDPAEYASIVESLPETIVMAFGWQNFGTPSGYLGSTVYGLVVAVLMMVFAIALGTRLLAGDEETGTLELTITQPLSRTALVLQRALAVAVGCLAMGVVVFVVVAGFKGPIGLEVPVVNVLIASFQLALLALVFGTLSLAIGSLVGKRGIVLGAGAAIAVVSYFGDTIVPQISGLAWFENLSVFSYYGGSAVLDRGFVVVDTLILLGLSVLFVAVAVVAFGRRDIGAA